MFACGITRLDYFACFPVFYGLACVYCVLCVSCFVRVCYVVSSQQQHTPGGGLLFVFETLSVACFSACVGVLFSGSSAACYSVLLVLLWFTVLFGGYSVRETPGYIPNPEAKTDSADGTALGRVWESRSLPKILLGGGASLYSHPPLFFCICVCVPHVFLGLLFTVSWKCR